jgi:hypothetical protein
MTLHNFVMAIHAWPHNYTMVPTAIKWIPHCGADTAKAQDFCEPDNSFQGKRQNWQPTNPQSQLKNCYVLANITIPSLSIARKFAETYMGQ